MTPSILTLCLALWLSGETPKDPPRKPNPFAPSLPQLTDEEEDKIDKIIDRFILYDTGKLGGAEGKKALEEFNKLGLEAIPALIRGLNRAAQLNHSCPAVVIAKKLASMLGASNDPQLLDFARENIGAGVMQSRHMTIIKDLRVACMLRKRVVQQNAPRPTVGPKPPRALTTDELVAAAASERGAKLKQVLTELEQRKGETVLPALAGAMASEEKDVQQLARDLLVRNLCRQTPEVVRSKLKDPTSAIRAAAAQAVGIKGWRFGDELIALLDDPEADVRQAARQALMKLKIEMPNK